MNNVAIITDENTPSTITDADKQDIYHKVQIIINSYINTGLIKQETNVLQNIAKITVLALNKNNMIIFALITLKYYKGKQKDVDIYKIVINNNHIENGGRIFNRTHARLDVFYKPSQMGREIYDAIGHPDSGYPRGLGISAKDLLLEAAVEFLQEGEKKDEEPVNEYN